VSDTVRGAANSSVAKFTATLADRLLALLVKPGARFLRSSPILSTSAIAVLGLGFGLSALSLALLWAFSSPRSPGLRPLGLATIAETTSSGGSMPVSWGTFERVRQQIPATMLVAAYSRQLTATLERNEDRRPVHFAAVSRGFFEGLTEPLLAGRDFTAAEETGAGFPAAILSARLATDLFGSPGAAIGNFVHLSGTTFEIVGVAPAGFGGLFGQPSDVWVPAGRMLSVSSMSALESAWKQAPFFYLAVGSAHLATDELVEELVPLTAQLTSGGQVLQVAPGLTSDPLRDARIRQWLRLALLLVLIFTAIIALNYALLLLARAPRLADEVRLKLALGGLPEHLLGEVLAGPAVTVACGLLVAAVSGGLLLRWLEQRLPGDALLLRASRSSLLSALGLLSPAAFALTLLPALLPAAYLLRDPGQLQLGYGSTVRRQVARGLEMAVSVQMALCICVWILAGNVIAAVQALYRVPLGYDAGRLIVAQVDVPPNTRFPIGPELFPSTAVLHNLLDTVAALPGVEAAAFATAAPFGDRPPVVTVQRIDESGTSHTAAAVEVAPGFFQTLGTGVLSGRDFLWSEIGSDAVIVSRQLAEELWGDQDAVGHTLRLSEYFSAIGRTTTWTGHVVGVVEDVRLFGATVSPEPTVYLPHRSSTFGFFLIVRGSGLAAALVEATVRDRVQALLPSFMEAGPVYRVEQRAAEALQGERERAGLALAGSLLMALVAYTGLYALASHYVHTRRRELAIRVSLGAPPEAIVRLVLQRVLRPGLVAIALTLPVWPWLARLTREQWLGHSVWSTGRAIGIALACVLLALPITLGPLRAALRLAPAEELRME